MRIPNIFPISQWAAAALVVKMLPLNLLQEKEQLVYDHITTEFNDP